MISLNAKLFNLVIQSWPVHLVCNITLRTLAENELPCVCYGSKPFLICTVPLYALYQNQRSADDECVVFKENVDLWFWLPELSVKESKK